LRPAALQSRKADGPLKFFKAAPRIKREPSMGVPQKPFCFLPAMF